MPVQLELDWILGVYRPLLRISETQVVLHDCSDQHVMNLIDEGRLRAFDLRGLGDMKRAPRVARYTAEHLALRPADKWVRIPVEEFLPITRQTLRRQELARWFGVAESTVAAWGLAGPSGLDKRSLYHREAVLTFLREREIFP